jgi:hypothetical protein
MADHEQKIIPTGEMKEGGVSMPAPVPVGTQFVGWQPIITPQPTPSQAPTPANGANGQN